MTLLPSASACRIIGRVSTSLRKDAKNITADADWNSGSEKSLRSMSRLLDSRFSRDKPPLASATCFLRNIFDFKVKISVTE
jgi:hypothetical protein